jgi:hypothetical protein
MRININKTLESLLPWDLTLDVCGTDYATLPPTVAQLGQIAAMAKLTDEQGLQLVRSLFADPKPQPETWSVDLITTALTAYQMYFTERALKNSRPIAAGLKAAMGIPTR